MEVRLDHTLPLLLTGSTSIDRPGSASLTRRANVYTRVCVLLVRHRHVAKERDPDGATILLHAAGRDVIPGPVCSI